MEVIKELSEKIAEEIHDAESYVKMAMEHRMDYPDVARTLYDISTEEMDHMKRLHEAAEEIIRAYRKTGGEPPAAMKAVYDYLHKKHIDAAATVRAMQAMYRDEE